MADARMTVSNRLHTASVDSDNARNDALYGVTDIGDGWPEPMADFGFSHHKAASIPVFSYTRTDGVF